MSRLYKKQQEIVFNRDGWLCRVCGKKAHHTHHIIFRRNGNDSEKNLISLCNVCHTRCHKNDKKWRPILISMQEEIYGHIDLEDMKKVDRYVNSAYPKFRR